MFTMLNKGEMFVNQIYLLSLQMKDQCRRCGLHIEDGLWCERCKHRVDEEFRGEVSRPYEYYFRHHLKRQRALDRKIAKELNSDL